MQMLSQKRGEVWVFFLILRMYDKDLSLKNNQLQHYNEYFIIFPFQEILILMLKLYTARSQQHKCVADDFVY